MCRLGARGSPSGKTLITKLGDTGRVQVWDWLSQTRRAEIPITWVGETVFFSNDERLANTLEDDTGTHTQVIDLRTGKILGTFKGGINWQFKDQQTSRDGNRLVLNDFEGANFEVHLSRVYDIARATPSGRDCHQPRWRRTPFGGRPMFGEQYGEHGRGRTIRNF